MDESLSVQMVCEKIGIFMKKSMSFLKAEWRIL